MQDGRAVCIPILHDPGVTHQGMHSVQAWEHQGQGGEVAEGQAAWLIATCHLTAASDVTGCTQCHAVYDLS